MHAVAALRSASCIVRASKFVLTSTAMSPGSSGRPTAAGGSETSIVGRSFKSWAMSLATPEKVRDERAVVANREHLEV